MSLWRFKLTRRQIKVFETFHKFLSYLKTLTKMELCLVHILSFHTLNEHILLIKCASDDGQYLKNNVYCVCANAPNTNICNSSPSNNIIMGFLTILILSEK